MHYGIFAFSKNGKGTLVPIDEKGQAVLDVVPGQRTHLSEGDVESVKVLYEEEFDVRNGDEMQWNC